MYIKDIKFQVRHRQHRGIVFESREALIAAIRALGYMLKQDEAKVEALTERMLGNIDTGMAQSGLLRSLMRGASEPAGPVVGPVTVAQDGWVVGAGFSEHNTFGLPNRPPFMGYSLRVMKDTSEDGGERFKLSITDLAAIPGYGPLAVSLHHTECLLAAQLGQPRLMASVQVVVFYEQDGPLVDFGFVPILDALASVEGLAVPVGSPEDIAEGYFTHMRDGKFEDMSFQVSTLHTSGCRVQLNGLWGIETHRPTIGRQLQLTLDGNRLMGPPDPYYSRTGPYATFGVWTPRFPKGTQLTPEQVLTANQQATDLADVLTNALWANNLG